MTWQETAKNLPQGHTTRIDCPECGEGTNSSAAIVNHNPKYYSILCYACDFKEFESKGMVSLAERKRINDLNDEALRVVRKIELPEDTTYEPTEFSYEARIWLYKGGLTPSVWKKYRIGYSKSLERVVLPVYAETGDLIWFQCRAILQGQRPKYIQPSGSRGTTLFTGGSKATRSRVVVVEDIMSAIRVSEAQSAERQTVSTPVSVAALLGTKITTGQAAYLGEFEECLIWLDGDKAGRTGAKHIRQAVGLLTTCRNIRTKEDPKSYSNKQIQEFVNG